MKNFSLFRNKAAVILATGTAAYLFAALLIRPDQPPLLFLPEARAVIDDFWQGLEEKPLIYPSRKKAITEYIAGSGGGAADGLAKIDSYSGPRDELQCFSWPVTRRKTRTWVVRNNRKDDAVAWFTAPGTERETTTFVFSGALGNEPGQAELFAAGEPVLAFDTGWENRPNFWEEGEWRLRFFPLRKFVHESGIFCLTVPAEAINPGQPVKIEVRSKSGNRDHSFFALHDHRRPLKFLLGDRY